MKLKQIASNMTVVNIHDTSGDGYNILFSYETPVAIHFQNGVCKKTDKFWSNTTSRHINKWLKNHCGIIGEVKDVPTISQATLDNLIEGIELI